MPSSKVFYCVEIESVGGLGSNVVVDYGWALKSKSLRSTALGGLFLQIKQALKLTSDFLSGSLQPSQLRRIQRRREKPGLGAVHAGHRASRHGRHPT